jgi:hypothetical protein
MPTIDEQIYTGLQKLNDDGKKMVLTSVKGAVLCPSYCTEAERQKPGKIINMLFYRKG